jgi:1-acyl-sn-glycerol-3-phosphate acyltransferase
MGDKQEPTLSRNLARAILRALGWKLEVTLPDTKKYVLIGAPHTSNWDFVFMLLFRSAIGINPRWIGKDTFFRWPFGGLWKRLGGIPVNRRSRNNFVDQMVATFQEHDELILVIAPEGTRSKTRYWKSGFYYITLGAGVPIVMGFLDYARKVGGIGPALMPTGDIQADFVTIREFYADKTGKYPREQSEVRLRDAIRDEPQTVRDNR